MYNCEVCGREVKTMYIKGNPLCNKHYNQIKKYGHPLDNNPRTIYDPNDYTIFGDITAIKFYDVYGNYTGAALINTEDLDKVRQFKWSISNSGYASNRPKNCKTTHMSRLIMGLTDPNLFIDHINHDKLDNRKANLRIVTKSQNAMNTDLYNPGCNYNAPTGKWIANIKLDQRMYNLGSFEYENQAAFVRWCAEKIIFGEYAFPKPMPFVTREDYDTLRFYALKAVNDKIPPHDFVMNF